MTTVAKFKKGALIRSESSELSTSTFIVEVTAKDGDTPRDVLEAIFEEAKYGDFNIDGFVLSEAEVVRS